MSAMNIIARSFGIGSRSVNPDKFNPFVMTEEVYLSYQRGIVAQIDDLAYQHQISKSLKLALFDYGVTTVGKKVDWNKVKKIVNSHNKPFTTEVGNFFNQMMRVLAIE